MIATHHTRNGRHVDAAEGFRLESREYPGTKAEPEVIALAGIERAVGCMRS